MRLPCLIASCAMAVGAFCACAQAPGPLSGRWRLTSGNAEIEIAADPSRPDSYHIRYIDGPDMSVPAGRIIGDLNATPVAGRYIGRMAVHPARPRLKHRDIVVELTDQGSLTFRPYRAGKRISFWRWIPYLFRVTVLEPEQHPSDTEGAVPAGRPDFVRHRVL